MSTIVDELKKKHIEAGGSSEDLKNANTVSEVIEKMQIGGGSSEGSGSGSGVEHIIFTIDNNNNYTVTCTHTPKQVNGIFESKIPVIIEVALGTYGSADRLFPVRWYGAERFVGVEALMAHSFLDTSSKQIGVDTYVIASEYPYETWKNAVKRTGTTDTQT